MKIIVSLFIIFILLTYNISSKIIILKHRWDSLKINFDSGKVVYDSNAYYIHYLISDTLTSDTCDWLDTLHYIHIKEVNLWYDSYYHVHKNKYRFKPKQCYPKDFY